MADYPTLTTDRSGMNERWRDPRKISISRSNSVKARLAGAARKCVFDLHHRLTSAEYDTLKAFYDANRALTFNFAFSRVIDGALVTTTHTVIFGESDIVQSVGTVGFYECSVQLFEV